jgi:hypothetical protein
MTPAEHSNHIAASNTTTGAIPMTDTTEALAADSTSAMTTEAVTESRLPWKTSPLAFVLGATAVLALLLGLVTPWVDVVVDRANGSTELLAAIDAEVEHEYGSNNPIGITLDDGPQIVVLVLVFAGLLALHQRRDRRGRGVPIGAFVAASLIAVSGIGNLTDIADKSDKVRAVLPVSLDTAFGLYLVVVGAVLAMCCAALATAQAQPKHDDSVA